MFLFRTLDVNESEFIQSASKAIVNKVRHAVWYANKSKGPQWFIVHCGPVDSASRRDITITRVR